MPLKSHPDTSASFSNPLRPSPAFLDPFFPATPLIHPNSSQITRDPLSASLAPLSPGPGLSQTLTSGEMASCPDGPPP